MKHVNTSALRPLLLALICTFLTRTQAQVGSTYTLTTSTLGTVAPIATPTALDVLEGDNVHGPAINIGFTFVFDGVSYTQLKPNSNGWLAFDVTDAPTVTEMITNDLANGAVSTRPCLAPLWDDLAAGPVFSGIQVSNAAYRTTGTAPNRLFTFEWQNWRWDKNGVGSFLYQITVQVKLYETTNVIEFVYSQGSNPVNNGSGGASIGIAGAGTGAGSFLSLNNTSATPVASSATSTNNLAVKPGEGQIYRFTPINYGNGTCSPVVPFAIPNATSAANKSCASLGINISGMPATLGTGPGQTTLSSVDLVIAHPNREDIDLTLTSPGGQTFNLMLDRGSTGDNFGIPGACPPATVFRLEPAGALLSTIPAATNNITGSFAPEQPLSGFTGNPNGVWVLNIYDDSQVAGTIGTIEYARLNMQANSPPDCLGVPGGSALPGTACNDGNACTINDVYDPSCVCLGIFQDTDGDLVCDVNDNCVTVANPGQEDAEGDGRGDACDNCPAAPNTDQANSDGDASGDTCDVCPAVTNGTPGQACNDGNASTVNDVLGASPACACAGTPCTTNLQLQFQLDGMSLVTWEIRAQGTNSSIQSGVAYLPVVGNFMQTTCVPDGCFYLKVMDDGGDGISGGGYILRTAGGKRIIDDRNNFLNGALSQITGNQGWCVTAGAIGNDRLITSSCDRLELQRGANAACSEKLTADNTPNNTSGSVYQFWVYNPNGPESQLIPATGAGSNILSMNQITLPAGKLYNVRVRTRIAPGVYREWGPACRMSISTGPTPCRITKLVDDANSANWSCGKTVVLPVLGGSNSALNMLVAKPATRLNVNCIEEGANKYQFRIKDIDTQVTTVVNGIASNYFCYMTRPTFALCRQYEVDVRCSFDGGTTWCTYSDVCPVFTGGCLGNGNEHMSSGNGTLQLHPNPNRGDQVTLRVEDIRNAATVGVDIYDAFGKRVLARTNGVQDGTVNMILDLNGSLTAGMYLMSITAGDAHFVERLVIQP